MDFDDYPMRHEADLMLALLRAAEHAGGCDEALARLNPSSVADSGETLARLEAARRRLCIAGLLCDGEGVGLRISTRGRKVLEQYPDGIDDTVLMGFREFRLWLQQTARHTPPEDTAARAYQEGWTAQLCGRPHSDNPYLPDTVRHQTWENGWFEARDEEVEHQPTVRSTW